MSTINPTLPNSSFIGNGDFTWWLGTVKNADDKDAKLNRVKVNILGYHKPEETPENLPWAMVMAPTDSAGANGVGSAANSLKPGSFVIGFFLDYPDCQQPIVMGTLLSKITPVLEKNTQSAFDNPKSFENSVSKSGGDNTNKGQSAFALASSEKESVSMSTAAATAPHSAANPSGKLTDVPVADGKNAGDKTLDSNLSYAITNIITTLSFLRNIDDATTTLAEDIDSEEQTIQVEDTSKFPTRGVLRIGSEYIGYNNKDEKKFVLAKRGFGGSSPVKHDKRATVALIPKSEYLGGEGNSGKKGDLLGTFTDSIVDLKNVIDTNLEFIKDSIWWLVNQIKSFLMAEITKLLNAIGIAAISPFPLFGKILTDAILFILKEIACILDVSLVDAIFSAIEDAIMGFVDSALSALEGVQCIFDAIFNSIFSIVDIAEQIIGLANDIASTFASVGEISNLSNVSQLNVTSILDFIFSLLGLGCNRDTRDPLSITFSSCPIASLLDCANGSPFDVQLSGIPGRWNPEYSKIIGTFSEVGSMLAMDDTPYNTRMVIEHGPSKSGIHIYDNGDVRITNSRTKTEVTVKDQEIVVHGNVKMTVDGDYHLKVGRDYHLEVLGMYNVAVNRESKLTYAGEHNCYFKNDAKLEANNGLSLVASKLGVSCSGQYEIFSPIITSWTTEQNHFCLGSHNVTALFQNNFIGLNKLKVVGGNNIFTRIGTNFQQGIGISNYFQVGLENEFWGGKHSQIGIGAWSENKLAIDAENTLGVTAFTKAALSFESVTGAAFKNTTGIFADTAEGIKFGTSAAIDFTTAPLITMN